MVSASVAGWHSTGLWLVNGAGTILPDLCLEIDNLKRSIFIAPGGVKCPDVVQ
jgi:hypothetical protein